MIRPYLTVVKDSFHEAFASRVLWILLAVSTLVLLALVPLGLREQRATGLRWNSIGDWPALIVQIKQQSDQTEPSPGRRIWELSSDPFKQSIDDVIQPEGPPEVTRDAVSKLLDGLNELITNRDLYDASSWASIELEPETTDLLERGVENLSPSDVFLLNRQLFKSAFPAEVAETPEEELHFSYLGWAIGSPLPISRRMAEPAINQLLAGVIGFFVGIIGVFIAILVTAPIIPHTFEAGAVDLLLSKPVGRSLLFLVKFAGGCAFILLNAAYFIVGLWLIMGLRFGLWNNALLLCIPLFLFLFAIYYSVSAFAAVLWKNAIVCVVITILFWAACFTVGTTKVVIEGLFLDPDRIVQLVPAGDALVGVNRSGEFVEWRAGQWEEAVDDDAGGGGPPFSRRQTLLGPVFDTGRGRMVYIEQPRRGRRFDFVPQSARLVTAKWEDGSWKVDEGPSPPWGAGWLFLSPQAETTVVTTSGVFRLDEDASEGTKVFGITLPFGGNGPYIPVGPERPLSLAEPFAAAMHAESGDLVVFSRGKLTYLRRQEDGTYARGQERDLEDAAGSAALAFAGSRIVVATSDGRVLIVDADLETRAEHRPAGKSEPYMAIAAPDGRRFAVLFHNGELALFGAEGADPTMLGGDVSAVAFDGNDRLLVADRVTRVTTYRLDPLSVEDRRDPDLDMLQTVYRYFVLPIYTVFPKPGELGNVVSYLLTDQETVAMGPPVDTDLREARESIDVWGPIWSSLAFVVVMLGVTCIYLRRVDI